MKSGTPKQLIEKLVAIPSEMDKSIVSFLRNLKNTPISSVGKKSRLDIVCGNESADLDSVVSVLTYSYFSHLNDPTSNIIPVVNISKDDLKLRRDVCYVLESSSISDDLLYYKEDLRYWKEVLGYEINATLVDHNDITMESKPYLKTVVGIIDHHQDLGLHISSISANCGPRIIKVAGSCSSLIFGYWSKILKVKELECSPDAIKLLASSLLIDTDNMKHKVEKIDEESFNCYKKILNDNMDFDTQYKSIREAKDDIDGLSLRDILRKDYKEFVFNNNYRCGIASMVKSLQWLEEKFSGDEFEQVCQSFSSERGLDTLILMCSFTENGTFSKQISFIAASPDRSANLSEMVQKLDEKLELSPMNIYTDTKAISFSQKNIKASRKQIAPYLKSFLEN